MSMTSQSHVTAADEKGAVGGNGSRAHARRLAVVLGTMEFGRPERQSDEPTSHKMVELFAQHGHKEVDTALMYVGGNTEKILGRLPGPLKSRVVISTKVNPWQEGCSSLSFDHVLLQLATSLGSLETDSVDILYLHAPDANTPIEETLRAVHLLHQKGKFRRFGLSNYAAWQVVEVYYLCKANGYVLPTVYQGMYNALTRDVEKELFPALRRLNIAFYAYNPLAGGLLTGRYKPSDVETHPTGRFFGNVWASRYRERFWNDTVFSAVADISAALQEAYASGSPSPEHVSLAEASLRWMFWHSGMKSGDAVIVGASSLGHLEQNLASAEKGPLDDRVVAAFDKGWALVQAHGTCPQYFR